MISNGDQIRKLSDADLARLFVAIYDTGFNLKERVNEQICKKATCPILCNTCKELFPGKCDITDYDKFLFWMKSDSKKR